MKKQTWIYCEECGQPMPATIRKPNHILHLILTILTGGLWLIIWAISGFESLFSKPKCEGCKRGHSHVKA